MIKERVEATPSNASPPENAPAWAIREGYQQKADNSTEEEIIPSADQSSATPGSSRSLAATRPRRIIGERGLNQAFDESDSLTSSEESEA